MTDPLFSFVTVLETPRRNLLTNQEHLDLLAEEFVDYYHHERPHQGKGNVPLTRSLPPEAEGENPVSRAIGWAAEHYYRKAA